jgi:hypothetical protein
LRATEESREVLGPLLVDVVAADVADARARLLEDYFTHKGEAPLSLPALLAYPPHSFHPPLLPLSACPGSW